jgi:hypothetical protein
LLYIRKRTAPAASAAIAFGSAVTERRRFVSSSSKRKAICVRSRATSVQRWMSAELRPGSSIGSPSIVMRMRFRASGSRGESSRTIGVTSTPS